MLLLHFLLELAFVNAVASPRVPPPHNRRHLHLLPQLILYLRILFLLELVEHLVVVLGDKEVLHQVLFILLIIALLACIYQFLRFRIESRKIIEIGLAILTCIEAH